MARLDFKCRWLVTIVALGAAFASVSCLSFKHKTFPELARFSEDEVEVVRVRGAAIYAAKKISGINEMGGTLKGIKGVETIECNTSESVAECRRLLPSRGGKLLVATVDDNDTAHIYGHLLPDGCIERMMITNQSSPSKMEVVIIYGEIKLSDDLKLDLGPKGLSFNGILTKDNIL